MTASRHNKTTSNFIMSNAYSIFNELKLILLTYWLFTPTGISLPKKGAVRRRLSDTTCNAVALADGLEKEDGGADADVEGIQASLHRDADVGIGSLSPEVR